MTTHLEGVAHSRPVEIDRRGVRIGRGGSGDRSGGARACGTSPVPGEADLNLYSLVETKHVSRIDRDAHPHTIETHDLEERRAGLDGLSGAGVDDLEDPVDRRSYLERDR